MRHRAQCSILLFLGRRFVVNESAEPVLFIDPDTGARLWSLFNVSATLNRLVDRGNTVVVIEHNLDVIKTTDWVIDLGPEGGAKGGAIVAEGTPENITSNPDSFTGKYLKRVLY